VYIRYRLLQAGAYADTVCTAEAVQQIARYARGNPRVMNVLGTNLLITGFLAKQKPIPVTMARHVIATYRAKNASTLRRRGVAYPAARLVVVGLAAAFQFQYKRLPVSEPGTHNLTQLTRSLQAISSPDTAPQPVEMVASPPLMVLSAPPLPEEEPPPTAA